MSRNDPTCRFAAVDPGHRCMRRDGADLNGDNGVCWYGARAEQIDADNDRAERELEAARYDREDVAWAAVIDAYGPFSTAASQTNQGESR